MSEMEIEPNYVPLPEPSSWDDVSGLNKAEDKATRNQIFAQAAAPTKDFKEGDLWFDTDDNNTIYRANSDLNWVSVKDGTILVGATTTFFQDGIPTSLAAGDLWIDSNDGNKLYRAAAAGADEIKAGEWILVGLAAGVTTFAQDAIPTALAAGDLWIDTNDGNKLYRAVAIGADEIKAGEWVELQDDAIAAAATTANWSGVADDDSNKPDNNATVGAVIGTNLNDSEANSLIDFNVLNIANYIGDGSDGDVTISADTTLVRNMYYNNLTINSGKILSPAGFKIYVKGTLTISGTIKADGGNGGNASGRTGGTAGAVAFTSTALFGGIAGVAGATAPDLDDSGGVNGVTGLVSTSALSGNGVAGGSGGYAGNYGASIGGVGGAATASTANIKELHSFNLMRDYNTDNIVRFQTGAGSGSGGSGATDSTTGGGVSRGGGGGGSGATGGIIWIAAKILAGDGTIQVNGGNGGKGGNASGYLAAGGGGGGGGNGGILVLIYNKKTFTGSSNVSGGTGGAVGSHVNTPTGGAEAGANGNDGVLKEFEI